MTKDMINGQSSNALFTEGDAEDPYHQLLVDDPSKPSGVKNVSSSFSQDPFDDTKRDTIFGSDWQISIKTFKVYN